MQVYRINISQGSVATPV